MKQSDSLYCAWADSGLALHNSGRALLCCHSRTYLDDDKGEKIYWHSHRLGDAWNSPTRQEIKSALSQGQQHQNCQACWDEESAGRDSRRTLTNRQFSDLPESPPSPALLDLKLGNTCNLACRTCWPEVSSKWYKDYWTVYDQSNTDYKTYLNRWKSIQQSYDKDNTILWDDLRTWLANVKYIDLFGAEPMLLDRLFDILRWAVANGHAMSQDLHINTNGTIWNTEYMAILTGFNQVNFDVSIDGIGTHYDYIRYGETWSVVDNNLNAFKALATQFKNIQLCVCVTVSTLNVYYLDEIWKHLVDRGLQPFFNVVHMPEHTCIRAIPDSVKSLIEKKLRAYTNDTRGWSNQIESVINFMNMPLHNADQHWTEFKRSTTALDKVRDQDFAKTFPEFNQLLATLAP
jgi:MoaA/NifB/PqqE/SkfB family radical SAM enzyme